MHRCIIIKTNNLSLDSFYCSVVNENCGHAFYNFYSPHTEFAFGAKNIGSGWQVPHSHIILSDSTYITFH